MLPSADAFIAIMLNLIARLAVGPAPHSGMGKPPMFGDYEAQRHWMEVTVNLEPGQWYINSSDNDLLYWGLDYPPLTAYHSFLLGSLASVVNGSWVELHRSRGMEDYGHKVFMRLSVISADMLIYLPAVWIMVKDIRGKISIFDAPSAWFLFLGLYPSLLVVDHAHFQYNGISLGLFLLAVNSLTHGRIALGSTLFALALNYKQMELYHALPMFFFILGTIVRQARVVADSSEETKQLKRGSIKSAVETTDLRLWKTFDFGLFLKGLLQAGMSVVVVFVVLWIPFRADLGQVLRRIFPFNRGLFEDKVANVWCATSPFVKWNKLFSSETMVKLCGTTTILFALPSNVLLFLKPTRNQFHLALVNTAFAFFLFSYHVHEKSILLVTTPVYLLFARTEYRQVALHCLLIAAISLHPLAVKDETQLLLSPMIIAYYYFASKLFSASCSCSLHQKSQIFRNLLGKYNILFHFTVVFGFLLTLLPVVLSQPQGLPDLYTMFLCMYCGFMFFGFFMVFSLFQFTEFVAKDKLF